MLEGVGSALSQRGFIQPRRNPLSCLRRETSQLLVLLGGGKGGWENQTSRWKKKKIKFCGRVCSRDPEASTGGKLSAR